MNDARTRTLFLRHFCIRVWVTFFIFRSNHLGGRQHGSWNRVFFVPSLRSLMSFFVPRSVLARDCTQRRPVSLPFNAEHLFQSQLRYIQRISTFSDAFNTQLFGGRESSQPLSGKTIHNHNARTCARCDAFPWKFIEVGLFQIYIEKIYYSDDDDVDVDGGGDNVDDGGDRVIVYVRCVRTENKWASNLLVISFSLRKQKHEKRRTKKKL